MGESLCQQGNKNISGKSLREKLQLLSTKFDLYLEFNQINLDNNLNSDIKIAEDFLLQSLPVCFMHLSCIRL